MEQYFSDLGEKMNKIIELLISSDELCKLLYYDNSNPLNEPSISNPSSLIMNKIYPMRKHSFAEGEKTSRVCAYFRRMEPYKTNNSFRSVKLFIDVICHDDIWLINNSIRPLEILSRIDKLFNYKYLSKLSTKETIFEWSDIENYADYYDGYYIIYDFNNFSNIGC